MGLRLNHLSASNAKQDGQHRNALVLSGAMYFDPSGDLESKADDHVAGFDGHADAAYIFSGSIGGNDKAVFLGDVVVSGSMTFDGGGQSINSLPMTENRVQLADDSNTLKDDPDLLFDVDANRLVVGDSNNEYAAVYLAADDLRLHSLAEEDVVGITAFNGRKLGLTGSSQMEIAANGLLQINSAGAIQFGSAGDVSFGLAGESYVLMDQTEGVVEFAKDADFARTVAIEGAGTRDEPTLRAADWAQMQGELDVWGPLYASGSITAFSTLDVAGAADFDGGVSANTLAVEDLTAGRVVVAGTGGELEVHDTLQFDGTELSGADITIDAGLTLDVSAGTLTLADDQIAAAKVTGLDGEGLTDTDGVLAVSMQEFGGGDAVDPANDQIVFIDASNSNGNRRDSVADFMSAVAGDGIAASNGVLSADGVLEDLFDLGAAASDGEFIVATGAGAFAYESGNTARTSLGLGTGDSPQFTDLTLAGDLTVNGTTTTVNSTEVTIADKAIVVATGSTDAQVVAAGGAGFKVGDESSPLASFLYDGADSFDLTDHLNLASGQEFKINDTSVLSADTLGSGVVNSSLTSVGTIANGTWNATPIATAYIADLAVTSAKIAADAVNGTKIADESIDSEHYVDGSIDREHLAADIVDGSKIADDSIDSEHYVAGSIDNEHIADATIANAKLVNDSVTLTAGAGMAAIGEVDLGASITVAVDGVLEDLDTLGAAQNDGEFIVATGAGAFAYESGNTARTSLGLGTGDTVQFDRVEIDDANHYLDTDVDGLIIRSAGNIDLSAPSGHIEIDAAIIPSSDNALDLGSSSARFANIYTGDLNLRNDRGDWTLIEENDFISFRNNKTGRRFRMVMEDITGTGTYGPGNDGEM